MDSLIIIYTILLLIIFFALGTSLTSFMIALIYRLEDSQVYPEIFTKRSSCEKCGKELTWKELVPVVSYLVYMGKCKKCGYKIPLSYPILEALLGVSYIYLYLIGAGYLSYFLTTLLYFLTLYDFYHKGFPKFIMHIYLAGAVLFVIGEYFWLGPSALLDYDRIYPITVSAGLSVSIILLNKIKESFGAGDILVFLFLGLLLEWQQLVTVALLSVVIGGVVALYLLVTKRVTRKEFIPFVPFIFMGYLLSFLVVDMVDIYFATYLALW